MEKARIFDGPGSGNSLILAQAEGYELKLLERGGYEDLVKWI